MPDALLVKTLVFILASVLAVSLTLQLQLIESSESMGDHDSGSDDWWRVG
jgi:hypothetical protein